LVERNSTQTKLLRWIIILPIVGVLFTSFILTNIFITSKNDAHNEEIKSIQKLYDLIRMLDAPGYPKAHIEVGNLKIKFTKADFKSNKLTGKFEVEINE